MITPVPIPLTRGRWLSSLENGQRLVEAAFFSLEMLTTLGWALRTASVTGVSRDRQVGRRLGRRPDQRRPATSRRHEPESVPSHLGQWHVGAP